MYLDNFRSRPFDPSSNLTILKQHYFKSPVGTLYFRVTFFSDSYRDTIQFSIYELTTKTAVVSLRHTPNLVDIYLNESKGDEEEEPEFEVLAQFLI